MWRRCSGIGAALGSGTTVGRVTLAAAAQTLEMRDREHFELYNCSVRRKSSFDQEKQRDHVERARRMTPEERLQVSINLSRAVAELHLAGKRSREGNTSKNRS